MPFFLPGPTSVFPAEWLHVATLEFDQTATSSYYSYIHGTHGNRQRVESRHNLPKRTNALVVETLECSIRTQQVVQYLPHATTPTKINGITAMVFDSRSLSKYLRRNGALQAYSKRPMLVIVLIRKGCSPTVAPAIAAEARELNRWPDF